MLHACIIRFDMMAIVAFFWKGLMDGSQEIESEPCTAAANFIGAAMLGVIWWCVAPSFHCAG
jgi:hypothetical protein